MPREAGPKKVVYEKIPRLQEDGTVHPIYEMMERIKNQYHMPALAECRIALMWHHSIKPDRDGRLNLGMAVRIGDRERQLMDYDAEIVLNSEWWKSPDRTQEEQEAILDHELCHPRPVLEDPDDPDSLPKKDENGKIVYYIRKHDFEEFREVLQRRG